MSYSDNEIKEFRDEYEKIIKSREARNNYITSRDRLFLPLAVGVFAFFISQMPNFISLEIEIKLLILVGGGVLLLILLSSWRLINMHSDMQIVSMYPDEVELEKKLKRNLRSKYIYNNLSCKSKKYLSNKLENFKKKFKYEDFLELVSSEKSYDYLEDTLQKYGYCAVGNRGHWIWHGAAIALFLLWVTMSVIILRCF